MGPKAQLIDLSSMLKDLICINCLLIVKMNSNHHHFHHQHTIEEIDQEQSKRENQN